MTHKLFALLFFILFSATNLFAQVADSLAQTNSIDSIIQAPIYIPLDSTTVDGYTQMAISKSFLQPKNVVVQNNIQQFNPTTKNVSILLVLMLMLGVLTYIKIAFGKELKELLQSVVQQNISQQIFRTQSDEITFSSFLLNLNFIIAISLYTRIIFIKYAHVSSIENLQTIFFLFFLFTFFYLGKIILTQFIGNVFEVSNASAEYIYNFTTICKSLGLMLIPALFIFYTAPENFFNFIFYTSIILSTIFVLLFIWRGLSTAYKLLYRGVYHFFIYVCVVEISVVFLFFKLLTKTII